MKVMAALGLRRESAPLTMHGRRLDALWKISNNAALNEEDMTRALLTVAAATLRPGRNFSALLHRVDRERNELIIEESIVRSDEGSLAPEFGTTIALADTPLLEVVRRQALHAAADVCAIEGDLAARAMVRETGMRAFIGTVFRAGDAMYTISLIATEPLDGAFDAEDTHFMESLATLLEKRLGRRMQRARMLARAEQERRAALASVIPRRRYTG